MHCLQFGNIVNKPGNIPVKAFVWTYTLISIECIFLGVGQTLLEICNCVTWWMSTKLTVIIILQYVPIANHYTVHLQVIQSSMSTTSQ